MVKGGMEVTRRRGRRRKKLLDDLKERRGYSHLKEEALDRTMWRNRFGGGFGPVVRIRNDVSRQKVSGVDRLRQTCDLNKTVTLNRKLHYASKDTDLRNALR